MSSGKRAHRQIRRAIGPDAADSLQFTEARIQVALAILRRGFWGRLKWLLLGR